MEIQKRDLHLYIDPREKPMTQARDRETGSIVTTGHLNHTAIGGIQKLSPISISTICTISTLGAHIFIINIQVITFAHRRLSEGHLAVHQDHRPVLAALIASGRQTIWSRLSSPTFRLLWKYQPSKLNGLLWRIIWHLRQMFLSGHRGIAEHLVGLAYDPNSH